MHGILIFDGLEPGRYELAESKIPDGYIMDEGPYYIVVNDDYTTELEVGEYTLITQSATGASEYTVKNTPGASLPNCGGPGTRLYTILGTILIAGAGLLLWRRRRTI